MAGIYRPRHPECTVLYRVLFHHFERFVAEYEERFERTYGYFRPIVKDVVEKYLDCGNPRCGFALMNRSGFMRTAKRCPDPLSRCRAEHLLTFSCKTRGSVLLPFLVGRELLSPEWAERLLSWPHTGFNVHSMVRAKTKPEAERLGKYMIRPLLALERLTFLEPEGKVGYRSAGTAQSGRRWIIWSSSPG